MRTYTGKFWRGNSQLPDCGYMTTMQVAASTEQAAVKKFKKMETQVCSGTLHFIKIVGA